MELLIVILCLNVGVISGEQFTLDKASDVDGRMWKVSGFASYLEDGNALRGPFHEYLPEDFDYGSFALSAGIWTVVPNRVVGCDDQESSGCDNVTSGATFRFRAAAQLLRSVTVQYNFGGNASLVVSGVKGSRFVDRAEGRRFDQWVATEVPLDGSSMTVEAIVYEKRSYVLIDKITVRFMEVPTKPPTTTTTEPPLVGAAHRLVIPGFITLLLAAII